MIKQLRKSYHDASLATKIRYSYLMLLVPVTIFVIFCFYNFWNGNRSHEDMISSTVMASEFSLDFKKDFDYEAYLLIVENKSVEESKLGEMLWEAKRIVTGLEELTDSKENSKRLSSAKKYLDNLETYTNRIIENLQQGNLYEENMEIWENDIQIVTTLIRETIFQYISFETVEMQQTHREYQQFFQKLIWFSIIASVLILGLTLFLSYQIPRSITRPLQKLNEVTEQVAGGNLSVRSDIHTGDEVGVLSESLNTMIDKINELLAQVTTEQVRLRKAEFELLQSQINPHFLYNTLDAIIWLAEAGEQKKVVSMVRSLSEFFRTSLNRGKDIIPLKEELQHVRSYLEIQQVRYQDILNYEINVPEEELGRYMIPKITIQPLVENALYHGIKNKRGSGKIEIRGRKQEEMLVIEIEDNGIGISKERLWQVKDGIQKKVLTGKDIYGLYNVNERIRLNFGEEYGIDIHSVYGEGTTVRILLPCVEE
ncbi:MAG: sensor histidine kinase [Lachnospiraceae bacterium]|nr:sensor histidine kinase [Lachnospiraceae bacterium]MBO5176799.1 sensor histidine kinase [Lachnospiraceae bacterium]